MKRMKFKAKKLARGFSDADVLIQFRKSMQRDNELRKSTNAPIAKYDVAAKRAYLEYPDGRIEYAANQA